MNVGIVGCGLIGQKRSKALAGAILTATADVVLERAKALAASIPGAQACPDWQTLVAQPDIDIVVVCTTNDALTPVSLAAVEAGKHVLVEKPAARTAAELLPLIDAAKRNNRQVRVGFNHRYHPALLKDAVTTPAGCTVDGILELEEGGLRVTLIKAVMRATERAKQLAAG